MSKKTNRTKHTPKPVAAVYEHGNVQVLVKDEKAKGVLRPLSQEEKDQYYPELDKKKPKIVAECLDISKDDIIRYDKFEVDNKALSELKAASKKKGDLRKGSKNVRKYFSLLNASSNSKSLITILFAAIVAQFAAFLPKAASAIRAIYFENDAVLNAAIVILNGINGSAEHKADTLHVRRPSYLEGTRVSVSSTEYSGSPVTYFGGTTKFWTGKKKTLWLPLWRRAIAVADNLPEAIRTLLKGWTSVLPIYFGGKAPKGISLLSFSGGEASVDNEILKKAEKGVVIVSVLFGKFVRSMFAHPKHGRAMFDNMDKYLPSEHIKGGGTVTPSGEQQFYAAGLCIYSAFFDYLTSNEWLSSDEVHELLTTAQDAVLPRAAAKGAFASERLAGGWSDREVFLSFLPGYLKDNAHRISFKGTPCDAQIIAAICKKDGHNVLAIPFEDVLPAYADFLSGFDEVDAWASDADFYRAAKKWGIKGFVEGSRETDPWRPAFYRKGELRSAVYCLGIPVSELPEDVRGIIEQARVAHNVDKEVL